MPPVRSPFGSIIFRWLSSPVSSLEGVRSTREQWQEKRVIKSKKGSAGMSRGPKKSAAVRRTSHASRGAVRGGAPAAKMAGSRKGPVKELCPE